MYPGRASNGRIVRSAIILASTAVYFSLAVLGGGGAASFFSHPALIALAVATAALALAALFVDGNLSSGVREDRANRWVILAFGLITILLAYLPAYADRKDLWIIDGETTRWIGVALYAGGGVLRLWPVHALGSRFSGLVAIQPGHALVTSGIYARIRHPSYLGLLVVSLGWSLAFRSGIGVLITGLMVPPLVARIRAEERLLRSEFGEEHADYCSRTARLIPGVW